MNKNTKIALIATLAGLIVINIFVIGNVDTSKKHEKTYPFKDSKKTEEDGQENEVKIGGDFELTDQNGEKFSSEKLKGKYSVIFFGFTSCPMICPTAMNNIGLVINELKEKADNYNFVFITTDPERDTPEKLKEFLANFSSKIIGLTGSEEQLKHAQKEFKVYAEKVIVPNSSDYDINHSSVVYIMDKEGKFAANFSHDTDFQQMVKKLQELN